MKKCITITIHISAKHQIYFSIACPSMRIDTTVSNLAVIKPVFWETKLRALHVLCSGFRFGLRSYSLNKEWVSSEKITWAEWKNHLSRAKKWPVWRDPLQVRSLLNLGQVATRMRACCLNLLRCCLEGQWRRSLQESRAANQTFALSETSFRTICEPGNLKGAALNHKQLSWVIICFCYLKLHKGALCCYLCWNRPLAVKEREICEHCATLFQNWIF